MPDGSVGEVGYRELPPPAPLRDLVETAWVLDPLPGHDGASPMELASAFVLRRDGDELRVVVYINHRDIAAALGERVSRG